jgi:hypothetical protein
MELDSPPLPLSLTQPHDHAVVRPCGRFQTVGQRLADAQRVVAHSSESLGNSTEKALPIVPHPFKEPMTRHRRGDDVRTGCDSEDLMAHAHAEHRQPPVQQQLETPTHICRILRTAGPGRDDHRVEVPRIDQVAIQHVVGEHRRPHTERPGHQLEQVVRIGIVVVYQQRPHSHDGPHRHARGQRIGETVRKLGRAGGDRRTGPRG